MSQTSTLEVSVLIVFFNRPETLRQVFDEVRKARPSRLFLYQDGPRSETDLPAIEACRAIVEAVDWPCEVSRLYQERNLGCDPSGFIAHRWAFSMADKVIVIEDDVVPSQSFFVFCKEMLDRYEHDERVTMVAGFNTDGVTKDQPADYFFTSFMSIWGWASWRRVAERWDPSYGFMADKHALGLLKGLARQRGCRSDMLEMFRQHSLSGKPYFESIYWADMLLNNGLCIMPTKNLVNNVGLSGPATHFSADLKTMPRRLRSIFTMPRYELQLPLKHPGYVAEDTAYKERRYKVLGWNHPLTKAAYSMEELWLNLRYGRLKHIRQAAFARVKTLMGLKRHR
ncbi:MAG: hemolysin activation protein [Prevotella sp.]|nr:hemolysin activation protein [Prevotella sp.]